MAPPTSTPEERAAKREEDRRTLRALMRAKRKDVQTEPLVVDEGEECRPDELFVLGKGTTRRREKGEEPLLSLEEFVGLALLPQVKAPPWSADRLSEGSSPISPAFSVASTTLSTLDDFPSPPSGYPSTSSYRPPPFAAPSSSSSTPSPGAPSILIRPLPPTGLRSPALTSSRAFSPSRPPASPLPPLPSASPSFSPTTLPLLSPAFDPSTPPRDPLPPLPLPSASPTTRRIRTSTTPSFPSRPLSFPTPPASPARSRLSARTVVPSPILTSRSSTYIELEDEDQGGESPVEFESLLASPLPKRRGPRRESSKRAKGEGRSRSPSSVRPAQNGAAVVGASEDETSQDSELDLEASVETLAWRAGIMKRDLLGGESATDEEGVELRPTFLGASERLLASEGDVSRGQRWQSAKNHRKSYKLMRQHSQDANDFDAADLNAALSSEEEESFDLSFDSHSNASGSTPSLSPFANSRRSAASFYGFPSLSSPTAPKPTYRRSQDRVTLLSPPTSSLELREGGRSAERKSWNGAHDSSRSGWRMSSLSAPDELSARADDSPPLPSSSTLPSLAQSPTTIRRISTSPGTVRHRTSIARPSLASRPLSSTSDVSSASDAGRKSSSSLPSLKKKSSTSTINYTSILPPSSKKPTLPSSATSTPPSRRSSIASSTSSTHSSTRRTSAVNRPPPVPDPSLLPPFLARAISPVLAKPTSLRSSTASKLPGASRIGTGGVGSRSSAYEVSTTSRLPSLSRQASTSPLRTPMKSKVLATIEVDEFGEVESAGGGGKAMTLPMPGRGR